MPLVSKTRIWYNQPCRCKPVYLEDTGLSFETNLWISNASTQERGTWGSIFLRCSEAHLLVEMKERHFYIFWVWMVGEIVNGWFIRCHCSLQNWTTPKLRKTSCPSFCLLLFHFFLYLFWSFSFSTPSSQLKNSRTLTDYSAAYQNIKIK